MRSTLPTRSIPRRSACAAAVAALLLSPAVVRPASAHPHVWVSVETTLIAEQGTIVGIRHRWTFDEFYTAMAIQGLDTNNDGVYSRDELAELAKVNIDGLKDFSYFTFARLGDKTLELGPPRDFWLVHGVPPPDSKPASSPANAVAAVAEATAPAPAAQAKPEPGFLSRLWRSLFGGGEPASPATAAAAKATEPAKVLALEFTAPLVQPVLVEAPDFSVSVHDPSWFIAFELAGGEPVKLTGAPDGCRIDLGDAKRASETDLARIEDAFSGQFGGAATARLSGTRQIRIACEAKQ